MNSTVIRERLSQIALASIMAVTATGLAWAEAPGSSGQAKAKLAQGPRGPVPQLTGINPNSAPPGGVGELVFNGANLSSGVRVRMGCMGGNMPIITDYKVESTQRATMHVEFPAHTPEGPCDVFLEYLADPKTGEIMPSRQGTPEVRQVKTVSFAISNSSPMESKLGTYTLIPPDEAKYLTSIAPKGGQQSVEKQQAEAKTMAEKFQKGEITMQQMMEYSQKMAQQMMAQTQPLQQLGANAFQKMQEWQKQHKQVDLRLKAGTLRCLEGNQSLLTQPASAVKDIAVVASPSSNTSETFHVAFSDGKDFYFQEHGAEAEVRWLKQRLGK